MSFTKEHSARKGNNPKNKPTKRYTCAICGNHYRMTSADYAAKKKAWKKACEKKQCKEQYAWKLIRIDREKQNKIIRKQQREQKEILRNELKSVTDWKNDLQNVVNWIVRELDKNRACISHPNTKGFLRWDAGHYYPISTCSDLRYNLPQHS